MIKAVDSAKVSGNTRPAVPGRRPLAQWIAAALAMGAAVQAHAGNPPVLSQAWLAAQRGQAGTPAGNAPAPVPNNLSVQNAPQLLQQRVVQQSIANLNQAAQAVAAQLSAQQAAQQAAQQLASNVPDGIAAGGLQVSADAVRNPALWQNANAPVQTVAAGKTTVEVKQTASKAILTWDSFNVGRNTTLYFNQRGGNQSSGGNDWIALNRIQDPSGKPSQILGQIKAEGSVYLLNRNGILFGAGSQVNTHALLASSLNLFSGDVATSNARFLNGGIADKASTTGLLVDGAFADGRNHDVVIEKGASITTGKQGFALVAAPHVANAGAIVTDDGQAILAGGTSFYNAAGADGGNTALLVASMNEGSSFDAPAGTVVNTGLVQARRGSVHLLGHDVTQAGVTLASTSVAYPGSIELNARDQANGSGGSLAFTRGGALVLAPGSVTAVLPEKDGSTTSSSAAADAAFKGSAVTLDGATVTLQGRSLLEAPGATVTIAAHAYTPDPSPTAGRVYVEGGAVVDVSGLANVVLPMSALLVNVSRIGQNELANSPLLRNGFLYTQKNVVVDSTQSGTRADGLDWVGSPILNVAGYVENVPRTVEQLMTKGGDLSLHGSEVIVRSGSQLNLDGGFLSYQAGWVTTPNLLGANGRVYDIAAADPDMPYVGFAGQYTQDHVRWGISQTYNNGLLAGSRRWDPGFIAGGDAGTLDVQAGHALVLDGDVTAQAFAGRNQVGQGKQPTGGSFEFTVSPVGLDTRYNYAPGILLQQYSLALDGLAPGFDADTAWDTVTAAQPADTAHDSDLRWWLPISTQMLGDGGFANVKLSTGESGAQILQQAGTSLEVRPGGSVSLDASRVTVLGDITAASGRIDIVTNRSSQDSPAMHAADGSALGSDITIGHGATLSTRGLWVNDSGLAADQRIGDRYVDGGKITLTANAAIGPNSTDATGSVLLDAGSTLDVSGGGYVGADARVKLEHGVPVGSGGDISLATYGNVKAEFQQAKALDSGALRLDGTLLGYGFSGGGMLSLQANYVQVGGDRSAMPMANGLYLEPGFFAGRGFDRYALTAITDGVIAPGAQVRVTRGNLLPDYQALLAAPTGSDLYASDAAHPAGIYATVGALDAYHRYVTRDAAAGPGFTLSAGQYLDWSANPLDPSKGAPAYAGVTGSVSVGDGASIAVDAGGDIALAGTQSTVVLGALTAHGGGIDIGTNALVREVGLPTVTPRVWLGASAVLDASGTALIDLWAAAVAGADGTPRVPRTGVVLDGGEVSLKARGGYLVAEKGSRIDVSGAADRFALPARNAGLGEGISYPDTPVWSDGGSITLAAAAGLYFDGQLQAAGGTDEAEGGTLTLQGLARRPSQRTAPSASGVLIQQSGLFVPAGASVDGAIESTAPSGVVHFAADRLDGSGIGTLVIGPDPSVSGDVDLAAPVPLGFAGDVHLALGRAFIVNAAAIQALPAGATALAGATDSMAGNGQVSIAAPYVNLTGGVVPTAAPVAMAGDGKLAISADFIDIGGWLNLQRWANASFESAGDIRFQAPALLAYADGKPRPGLLFSTGDLSFKAAQLYPATDYRFAVVANGSGLKDAAGNAIETTLSILPNGRGGTPLSAGGSLLLSANRIEQQGTLRAPSGNLVLGVTDAAAQAATLGADPALFPLAATQSVHLAPGSLTSVSLEGVTVPYGSTIDGVQWRYDADPYQAAPDLTAPPSKQIALNGADLALDAGAGIDLSGGGHLQAAEWVAGIGGTRDVLAQYGTSYQSGAAGTQVPQYADGRAVYAIVPGYRAPVAAYDAAFAKQGGDGPSVGQSVYLSGAPGLPAGYYTLLPARYATLPGAYRVVQDTGAKDSVLGSSAVQPDGTLAIGGYFADALSGARDARNTTFLVQSGDVWQQYSQYRLSDADTFFANLAQKAGKVAPALAADAGRLALAATRTLDLGAALTAAPAKGGRGSQVDIAAQAIQVVGADANAREGYLALSADGLSTLGAGSLLLGGTRRTGDDGDHVSVTADSVVLANDAAHPLQGAEILLAANGGTRPGAQGVLLETGSVLRAAGQGTGTNSLPLVFGAAAGTDANGRATPAVSGDGALLRVSQNGAAGIVRNSLSTQAGGALTIASGARIDGGAALTLDATGATSIDPSAALSAQAIDANSNLVTFLGDGAVAPAGPSGFVIGRDTLDLLRGAQSVTLRSRGDMNFLGNVRIDLAHDLNLSAGTFASDGGTVDIEAGKLALSNDLGAANGSFATGAGQFTAHANEVDFGPGTTGLRGFGGFSATASQGMQGQGTGRFDFGSLDVNLTTPWLLAGDGADTTLATTGALNVGGSAGAIPDGHLGGALSLSGGSVSIGTAVAAPAGMLDIHATRGDVAVNDGALLTVAGINKIFFDTTTYAAGGALRMIADHGGISLAQGATLDFAGAAGGGDAGRLDAEAGAALALAGTLRGQARDGYRGGYLTLGSGTAMDLDATAQLAADAGATGLFQLTTGAGDLHLSNGHTLRAQKVYLSAAGGTVSIDGTVDASAPSGSRIELYGERGVDVEGNLVATSSIAAQRGGDVVIGTGGSSDGTLNAGYGYQNVQYADSGYIHLGPQARIDVSGGSSDAFSGGSVSLRAPLLADGDVRIAVDGGGSSIKGARVVTLEPYARWSTKDASSDPSKHFDGLIDPAGWYATNNGGTPALVEGTWTDASGKVLPAPADDAQLKAYLEKNYFTPKRANGDHAGFYGYVDGDASKGPGTLMRYVQQPGYAFGDRYAGIANLQLRPGIELVNPADGTRGGDVAVLTNWNLGAGTTQADGSAALAYRYQGMAPMLTVRAASDLDVQASITDGFYQQNSGAALADPPLPPPPVDDHGYADALAAYNVSQQYLDANGLWNGTIKLRDGSAAQGYTPGGGTISITSDPYYQALQAPLTGQTANYYTNYEAYIGEVGNGSTSGAWAYTFNRIGGAGARGFLVYNPSTLAQVDPAGYPVYQDYVAAYQSWLKQNFATNPVAKRITTPPPLLLPLDGDYTAYTADYAIYITGHNAYFKYVSGTGPAPTGVGTVAAGTQLFYAPFAPKADPADPLYAKALADYQKSQQFLDASGLWNGTIKLRDGSAAQGYTPGGGTVSIASDPYYQALQAPLAGQSGDYYANYEAYIGEVGDGTTTSAWAYTYNRVGGPTARGFLAYKPSTLPQINPASYPVYQDYVAAYQSWLKGNFATNPVAKRITTPPPLLLPLDSDYTGYTANYATYIGGHSDYFKYVSGTGPAPTGVGNVSAGTQLFYAPFAPKSNPAKPAGGGTVPVPASAANNGPSNMPSLGSPASFASATLLGGSSTSYRLVAGARADAADPLSTVAGAGDVNFDGHFGVVDTLTTAQGDPPFGKTLLLPNVVRTGSGSIDIASGGNLNWLDAAAPAAVYTAGTPAPGTSADTGVAVIRPEQLSSSLANMPYLLSTGQVNPEQGGDLSLSARGDINAIQRVVDTDGSATKLAGTDISPYWWPWMQTANAADGSASSINFANFGQGVMSAGGNVAVNAGGDIRQLSVSLPTTWKANADGQSVTTYGGGNLDVRAGGDILSGTYFVAKGQGRIESGGAIGADFRYTAPASDFSYAGLSTPVSTLFALQDAQLDVRARTGADIGGVYNPSYLFVDATSGSPAAALLPAGHGDAQSYSAASSFAATSTGGDVVFDSLRLPGALFDYGSEQAIKNPGAILPATLSLTAPAGSVDIRGAGALYPSAQGNLTVLADQDVRLSQQVSTMQDGSGTSTYGFGLIDAPASLLPSPLYPAGEQTLGSGFSWLWLRGYLDSPELSGAIVHAKTPLHADDASPVRLYALHGDIVDGIPSPAGFQYRSLQLTPGKPALVRAGRDIVNLSLLGQQSHDADVTLVSAGRDIYDLPVDKTFLAGSLTDLGSYQLASALLLGGPGSFLVEAGRNIGPLTSQAETASTVSLQKTGSTGIDTVGNQFDPYLPHASADINVLYGVGPGVATADFMARYVDSAAAGVGSLMPDLVAFMERRVAGRAVNTGYAQDQVTVQLTAADARRLFDQEPDYVQRQFVSTALFKVLAQVGADYNDRSSPYFGQYARGYAAIGTLFPASLGYTANGAGQGGLNGAQATVDTGDLDLRSTTIQTQQGGDVTVLGPGGQALLGSASAPPVITDSSGKVLAGPNTMGVLTLEQGDIRLFTDRSVLLAQSRVFTEQGGDLVIWSSNGDINAGQGAKTTAEIPPPTYLCTVDAWCRLDARGQVSGAGIATLQTVPGAPEGSVYLVAPRGTVDAGDAGIRVSGNLIVAAARVANADNIQVQGEKIGVPVTQSVNVGALNAANAAASAVSKAAEDMARQQQDDARSKLPSVISVQVLGAGDTSASLDSGKGASLRYDPSSPVQVLGGGMLSSRAMERLTPEERKRLAQ
ncbi:filamentous hemagglutinin family protein [Dyella sp. BiH032]|uniref:filamentous haemagglutinin family protein n=1 Tax=Dyella sp. BiH032 TaxID=3075430 RepID=UPI0028929ACA|nr:filamentous haemagglutinin family protein [Dyella sp. BiH032]WNL44455.1 filamentous hemagglutinin family protein [Dyella sp. BiH032]